MSTRLATVCLLSLMGACAEKPAGPSAGPGTGPVSTASAPAPVSAPDEIARFHRELEHQGVRFVVDAQTQASGSQLAIAPYGLSVDSSPISRIVDGQVTGAEVGDVNGDGSPELYVYARAASGAGQLIAYSANGRKSLSEIAMPELADDPVNSAGYLGHDEFRLVGDGLDRRFPVSNPGQAGANLAGKFRTLHYSLVPGEATWQLRLDRVSEQ